MPKCPPTGGVRLQEVSVSGGSTVYNKEMEVLYSLPVVFSAVDVVDVA